MDSTLQKPVHKFLESGGAMSRLIQEFNWSATSLGDSERWSLALQSALSICLNSPFPIAIYWGKDYTLLYNDAWSSIPGDKHPWALGRPGKEVWPEIWGQIEDQFLSVLVTGNSIHSKDTLLPMHRFGYTEECYFDYTLSPIWEANGTVGGIFNAVIETTYQVINQRRNQFLHRLVQQVHQPLSKEEGFQLGARIIEEAKEDIPFCILYEWSPLQANPVLKEVAGISREEVQHINWPLDNMIESGGSVLLEHLDHYLEKPVCNFWPEPCSQAMIIPLKQGQEGANGFIVAGISPRKKTDEEYLQFLETVAIHIATAITHGHAREEEQNFRKQLIESEQNFRKMVMQAPVGICILEGSSFRIEIANDSYLELVKKQREEILGLPITEALAEAKDHPFIKLLREVWATGQTYSGKEMEVRQLREGMSRTIYVDFVCEPIKEMNGVVKRIMVLVIDVTDKVQSRKKIQENEAELIKRVAERTEELEWKNQELEQFAYAASHDMQEPLRKVTIFSNFLQQHNASQLDEKGRLYLKKIEGSVSRMKIIIDDLLQYSHETREQQHFEPSDLNVILDNIETDLELAIQQKNARIIREDLPLMKVIPTQINQLLFNLVTNSLKFAKPGVPAVISIEASEADEATVAQHSSLAQGRRYVQLSFKDNGIGFEQQYADQIFTLFKRLHGRNEYEGTGIGLSLCKKIVQNHGGVIYARSQPGEGATFYVLLPWE